MALLDLPTTNELATTAVNKIVSAMDTAASALPKAFLRVLSNTMAGLNTTTYKYAGFNLLQQYAETATFEEITILGVTFSPLKLIGQSLRIPDPGLGTAAQITLTATSPTGTGDPVPAGAQLLGDNGLLYQVLSETAVSASFALVVECLDVGSDGDLSSGSMEFIAPLDNVDRFAIISSLTAAGTDDETEEEYRARCVEAQESPAQGGAYADYRLWAQGATGVLSAYPYTGDPMEVNVYVEGGDAPDYIPDSTLLTNVLTAINLDEDGIARLRPCNDIVNVLPIVRTEFDVEITGFTGTADEQTQIETAIDDRLRARRPFIDGLDPLPRQDEISRDDIGGIVKEICSSLGRSYGTLTIGTDGAGTFVRYFLDEGEKAKAGTVTWS